VSARELSIDARRARIDALCRLHALGSLRRRLRMRSKTLVFRAVVGGTQALKRSLDVVVSVLALLALAPLLALVALAIKLTDGGAVLFWQSRVGRHGREFRFPKFRSMVADAEARKAALAAVNSHGAKGVTFKMKGDPRITRIGRVIRRLSIDELPQLWLVLTGDMSLVGPRPPVPSEVARYTLEDRRRLEVTPGLTCIWQVSGRSEIPFERQVGLDVEYIESRSFLLDLRLLARTVPAVLAGRGAL
jgi:lipopolysaccharide/colanic/teichoic acid biosynthesis glycosyltransferase